MAAAEGLRYSGIAGQILRAGKLRIFDPETVLLRLQQLHEADRIRRGLLQRLVSSVATEPDEK